MSTIFDFNKRIQAVEIRPIIALCLEQSQYEVLAFNKGKLYMGEGADGRTISPPYKSQEYAEFKQSMNPKPGFGVRDYFLTGEYFNGFFMEVNKSQMTFTVGSKDTKAAKIEKQTSSKQLYGLAPDDKAYFSQEILRPKIVDKLRAAIGV